jgi:hypothetical protein
MRRTIRLLLFFSLLAQPAHAQAICSAQRTQFQEVPAAGPQHDAFQKAMDALDAYRRMAEGAPEERRFSYWGYRHKELHARGIPQQIIASTGSNCCGGADSGECRVSSVNFMTRQALIDDRWCPFGDAKITVVEGLANDEPAVVCASRSYYRRACPSTYCIGVRAGG